MENAQWLSAKDGEPVYDDRRSALNPNGLGPAGLCRNDLGIFAGIETFIERGFFEPQFSSEAFEVVPAERALIFAGMVLKQVIVVLPESVLLCCTLAGLGCPL